MNNFLDAMRAGQNAQQRGLLKTAVAQIERALTLATTNHERAFASYNLGALHWGETGDGVAARSLFAQTVTAWEAAVAGGEARPNPEFSLLANAAENLMLLSLSFDEYDRWTEKLRHEAPQEAILHEHVPHVQEARDRGESWAEVMLACGMAYIRPGDAGGGPHPASGACIFHLLVQHRKALRASSQIWQGAVLGQAAAMSDVLSRVDALIFRTTGRRQPEEFAFASEPLMKNLAEYCAENPHDEPVVKTKQGFEQSIRASEAQAAAQPATRAPQPTGARSSSPQAGAMHWASVAALIVFGLLALVSPQAPFPKSASIAAIALGVIALLVMLVRRRPGSSAGTPMWQRNAVVEKEIGTRGLKGLAFQLTSYEVVPGDYLYLNFQAASPVPEDKQRHAKMALRCIVALTLPHVVKGMPGHRLADGGTAYTIGFGDGVRVPFYELRGPVGAVSTLQVGSEVDGDTYQVTIHPSMMAVMAVSGGMMAGGGPGAEIQAQLGRAFVGYCGKQVLTL